MTSYKPYNEPASLDMVATCEMHENATTFATVYDSASQTNKPLNPLKQNAQTDTTLGRF